jgi:hypothetical protein
VATWWIKLNKYFSTDSSLLWHTTLSVRINLWPIWTNHPVFLFIFFKYATNINLFLILRDMRIKEGFQLLHSAWCSWGNSPSNLNRNGMQHSIWFCPITYLFVLCDETCILGFLEPEVQVIGSFTCISINLCEVLLGSIPKFPRIIKLDVL